MKNKTNKTNKTAQTRTRNPLNVAVDQKVELTKYLLTFVKGADINAALLAYDAENKHYRHNVLPAMGKTLFAADFIEDIEESIGWDEVFKPAPKAKKTAPTFKGIKKQIAELINKDAAELQREDDGRTLNESKEEVMEEVQESLENHFHQLRCEYAGIPTPKN